jgi:hypothetical protein
MRMSSSENSFTPITDELLGRNHSYADRFDGSHLDVKPKRQLAVVGCMDAPMDTFKFLACNTAILTSSATPAA